MSGQDEMSPLVQPLPITYSQDDPELIEIIRKKYLIQPSEQGTVGLIFGKSEKKFKCWILEFEVICTKILSSN